MIFSDTKMMEIGIRHKTNVHNTRSLIRTLKYVFLQTEAFTEEEYKHTHTHTHTHTHQSLNAAMTELRFWCKLSW